MKLHTNLVRTYYVSFTSTTWVWLIQMNVHQCVIVISHHWHAYMWEYYQSDSTKHCRSFLHAFKPGTDEQVFLDKFTYSCIRSRSFLWQVSLDRFCCSRARNVIEHLSEDRLLLAKTTEVFLVHLSCFTWRTNFPRPKAGMTIAVEQGSLARE
jgi:hypothetical protein